MRLWIAADRVYLDLLVLSAPRSGSRHFADRLTAAGLRVGHERAAADAIVTSWLSYDSIPAMQRHGGRRTDFVPGVIVHLVREPLATIRSLCDLHESFLVEMARVIGHETVGRLREPEGAAELWLWYMRAIEAQRPDFRIRVEAVEPEWGHAIDEMRGAGRADNLPLALPAVERRGARERYRHRDLRYADLGRLGPEVGRLARRYGYGEP